MKGYRERYRPVPLFTEGYRPAQGYRHVQGGVQGYKPGQGSGVQACTGGGGGGGVQDCTVGTGLYRGKGMYMQGGVPTGLYWGGGGGGGGGVQDCTRVQACTGVQACTRVMACTGRGSGLYSEWYRPIKLYRPVQFGVQPIVLIHSSCSFMMNSTYI